MKQPGSQPTISSRLVPGLDGLRALAVIAVIAYHLFPTVFVGGYIGVDVFFVISGYLITTLLIAEHLEYGRINLKKFWLRRARRLLPALIVTILTISSIIFFVRGDVMVGLARQILGAATFSSNWTEIVAGTDYFTNTTSHLFMNFWSLAVEEQFYLIWPFLVILLVAVVKRPRMGMVVTALLGLASAGWMAYSFLHGASASRVYYGTDTHLFGLMTGAFLAFLASAQNKKEALRRLYQPFWFVRRMPKLAESIGIGALVGLGILFVILSDRHAFTYTGGLLLASLLGATVLVITAGKRGPLQKLFQLPLFAWIGSRSYGIYLWHWPLIVIFNLVLATMLPIWLVAFISITTTFCVAELSYRYIELPIRHHGFRVTLQKAIKKRPIAIDEATMHIRKRPHSVALAVVLGVVLTTMAVVTAPAKTSAQLRVEAGERAVASHQSAATSSSPLPVLPKLPVDGPHITAIGDSVMLAGSPALQAKFPGILINAEISRSMRRGGLETVQQLQASGQLRAVVIVAFGTNGYFGAGNLDTLIAQLKGHKIVLVTAHADREWTAPNNQEVETAAKKHKDVSVAEWDQVIASRPDLLAPDGIHPATAEGDALYIDCISKALDAFR